MPPVLRSTPPPPSCAPTILRLRLLRAQAVSAQPLLFSPSTAPASSSSPRCRHPSQFIMCAREDGLSAWRASNWPGDPRERSIRARHQRRHQHRHQALQTALQAELAIVSAHFTLERRCHRALQTALRVDLLAMVAITNTKRNKRISYRVLDPELLCDIRAFDRTSRLRVHSPVRCGWGAWCLGVVEGTLALAPWLTRLCLLCGRPMATPRRSPVLPLHCRCRLTRHINILAANAPITSAFIIFMRGPGRNFGTGHGPRVR